MNTPLSRIERLICFALGAAVLCTSGCKKTAPEPTIRSGSATTTVEAPASSSSTEYAVELANNIFRVPDNYSASVENEVLTVSGPKSLPSSMGKTNAVSLKVNEFLENVFSENTVRVVIVAKGGTGTKLAAAYSTDKNGNSGWTEFGLSPEYREYGFDYAVPKLLATNGDYIGLAPLNGKVQIKSVTINCGTCRE